MLQHNKVASNLLVKRLGFPGVEHGVADNIDNAQRLADQIGYPVVIKPIDSSQGRGVTPGITSGDEIPTAFAAADTLSPGRVIIERFVKGDTFRLAVFGGELAFATLRSPPQIVGTGDHTVAELIQIENQRRAEQQADAAAVSQLTVDASMLTTLQKQKLSLNDRVPAGQIVKLQSVANMRTGQISTVVTDRLHPDNREMAEAITRCFRLDTAGIDFVTPDIAGSWRAVPCAVIEVNSAPQLSFPESQARILLERAFPGTSTGRIASAIVVTGERGLPAGLSQILQHQGVTLGFAEPKSASLGGRPRFTQEVGLADRVTALLLDPACQAVVIASTTDDIVRDGLPIDRCDVCIVDPQITLTEPLRTLLTKCSSSLITDDSIEVALARWLAQMRASQP
jgi:cyanophycin synthetase